MQLSDAIRLGAMLHPQAFGKLYTYDRTTGAIISSCVLGAALNAGFAKDQVDLLSARVPLWFPCPANEGHCCERRYGTIIVHLNDDHKWTRERIADWVESVEHAQEQARATNAVDPVALSGQEVVRA